MLILEAFQKVCETSAGITRIRITDPMNLSVDQDAVVPEETYEILYSKYTAKYTEKAARGEGGDYFTQELIFFLPKRQSAANQLRIHSADRRIAALCYNRYGNRITIPGGTLKVDYDSGQRLGDIEGYQCSITGIALPRAYNIQNGDLQAVGDDGIVPGDPTLDPGTITPGSPSVPDCCVKILDTPLLYNPSPTGNSLKSRIVIGADGNKYFIDHEGKSIIIEGASTVSKYKISTAGYSFTIPFADTYELLVFRMGIKQNKVVSLTDINQYTHVGTTFEIDSEWPLESGEFIEIYKV